MVLKRVVAYFIDIILVTFVASMLASISYLNPQLNDYNKVYDEYVKFSENYVYSNDEKVILEYKEKLDDYSYQMDKNNIYGAIISVSLMIIYFVFFQKYNGGQTLGKKIMKIKIDGDLSLFKYFLRALILYNLLINIVRIIYILSASKSSYIKMNNICYILALLIEVTIIIMVTIRNDKRGLHDLIVDSNVVPVEKIIKEKGDNYVL